MTVLLNASLRETVKLGPSTGDDVVDSSVMDEGGEIAKSGICITVPSYTASSSRSPTAYTVLKLMGTMAVSLPDRVATWSFGSAGWTTGGNIGPGYPSKRYWPSLSLSVLSAIPGVTPL